MSFSIGGSSSPDAGVDLDNVRLKDPVLWRVRGQGKVGSLAVAGDANYDGYEDVQVGIPGHASKRGRVEVRSGRDGTLLGSREGALRNEEVGYSVASVGYLRNRFKNAECLAYAVGSPGANVGLRPGWVTLYTLRTNRALTTSKGSRPLGRFGHAVAGAGDQDGDGWPDFVVGGEGSVSIFSGLPGNRIGSAGSVGVGSYRHPDYLDGASPRLGDNVRLHLYQGLLSRSGQGVALLRLGLQRDELPLDFVGMKGCVRNVKTLLRVPVVVNKVGFASIDVLTIPDDPSLIGLELIWQWLILDQGANPAGLTMSDAAMTRIGAR